MFLLYSVIQTSSQVQHTMCSRAQSKSCLCSFFSLVSRPFCKIIYACSYVVHVLQRGHLALPFREEQHTALRNPAWPPGWQHIKLMNNITTTIATRHVHLVSALVKTYNGSASLLFLKALWGPSLYSMGFPRDLRSQPRCNHNCITQWKKWKIFCNT